MCGAGTTPKGKNDFYFAIVELNDESFRNGDHFAIAELYAKAEDIHPRITFDEFEAAGVMMMKIFDWESASVISGYSIGDISTDEVVELYNTISPAGPNSFDDRKMFLALIKRIMRMDDVEGLALIRRLKAIDTEKFRALFMAIPMSVGIIMKYSNLITNDKD